MLRDDCFTDTINHWICCSFSATMASPSWRFIREHSPKYFILRKCHQPIKIHTLVYKCLCRTWQVDAGAFDALLPPPPPPSFPLSKSGKKVLGTRLRIFELSIRRSQSQLWYCLNFFLPAKEKVHYRNVLIGQPGLDKRWSFSHFFSFLESGDISKHLMTDSRETVSFVSPRPHCSPQLRLGEHWGFRGNTLLPWGPVIKRLF